MTIKITGCSKPGIWYENKIGRSLEVDERLTKKFGCKNKYILLGAALMFVYKCDCEVIKYITVKPKLHRELITIYGNKQHVA